MNIKPMSIQIHSRIRFMASKMLKNRVFWLVTPCSLVQIDVLVKQFATIIRAGVTLRLAA
jgi:hypothetical protein